MQAAQDRQKSYADRKRKPMEFEVGDRVMLKVSPWKGVVRFGKRVQAGKHEVRRPFKVLARLERCLQDGLPRVSRVPHTFHVSNLKKCRKPASSFMRPFVCPVTILNILDHLGTGPKWMFDNDTLTMSMNYQPVFARNQTNGNVGTNANIDEGQGGMKTVPGPQYVLLPFLNFDSQSPKSSEDEGADDARKKNGVLDPAKEDDKSCQVEATNTNSTNRLNTVSLSINTISSSFTTMDPGRERAQRNEFESVFGQDKDANGNNIYRMFTPVNAAGSSCNNLGGSIPINAVTLPNADLPTDPLMPEDTTDFLNTGIFSGAYDDEYVGAEADFNNLEITMNSAQEHAMVSYIKKQRRTNHKDYQNCLFAYFLSQIEPKKVTQALSDPSWIVAMQDELLQIEVIRLFLSYASFMGFIVYEMDVKSAFLYCIIEEEVCVYQPPGFEDPQFLDKVYKVEKALYGLHQDPRAWYETLSTYLFENGFRRGTIDKTLSIKKEKCDILLVQVYVDDIIFGSTKKSLCTEFESLMHKRFQMSSIRELTFFLGLQVKQKDDGIFISQDKYVADILKKFDFVTVKTASTPIETNKALLKDEEAEDVDVHLYRSMIGSLMYLATSRPDIMFAVCACARFQVTPKISHLHAVKRIFRYLKGQPKLGLWYPRDSPFNLEAFSDSDYAGASLDRKSTIEEYVAAANCYGQIATVRTVDNGEQEITITVDGKEFTITEASLRIHLQLADAEGISALPTTEIFDQFSLMGYVLTDDKLDFSISEPIPNVADEVVYVEGDDRVKRATTNAASLYAARASGGSPGCQEAMGGSITQTRSERVPTSPYDLPLSRVNTLGSYEGSMTLLELTVLCTTLSKKVESLEADLKQTKKMWVAEADFNNLETTMNVSPIPTTRIHKDHTKILSKSDHNLWDVIVNGDLEEESAPTGETFALPASETAKHLACRRNQGRNQEVKKNVLKHQFENFSTASNENLDKAYDRFQKLISQLEVHGAPISKEDINQKFLRSLPPSWNQIALIMRNKPDIDEIDIDDLYNNLRVYEDELKSTASGDFGVSTAGGINQVPSTPCAHDVAYSFFAQPTTSPQLENEDFQQMDGDDLEELDLRWQVAMLTVRVKKFIQRTGRNLDFKEKRHVSLDKSKIECYNCHRKGHFARECRSGRNQGRRSYGDNGRSNAPTNESSSQALVAQDGLGGYDWSNDFEVEPVKQMMQILKAIVQPVESVVSNPKIDRDRVIIEDWNSDDKEEVNCQEKSLNCQA
ncbi:putative ribonuclease H-like domain-containing protein [Tanacetum coccineum]